MKIEDVKVKVVVDDAQARVVIDELLRCAAAFEQLLLGLGKALSSDAGQAVVIDALVRRIEELKVQADNERWRSNRARQDALACYRALAVQFEEGDLVELQTPWRGLEARTILKVETTVVQRLLDGTISWGGNDGWAPTVAMCSYAEASSPGNIEIPLTHLRLVTKGGA